MLPAMALPLTGLTTGAAVSPLPVPSAASALAGSVPARSALGGWGPARSAPSAPARAGPRGPDPLGSDRLGQCWPAPLARVAAMTNPFDDPDARYLVVVNVEGQHA